MIIEQFYDLLVKQMYKIFEMTKKHSVLSNNIKYLRKKLGYNQEQLAQALTINRSNIAAYEAKNVEPRLRIILEMSELFDIDLKTFLQTYIDDEIDLSKIRQSKNAGKSSQMSNTRLDTNINLDDFVEKSAKIKKILIGLKSFHQFRKNNNDERTPKEENILSDIDNFIMLMEHLLLNNENLVKSLNMEGQENSANSAQLEAQK